MRTILIALILTCCFLGTTAYAASPKILIVESYHAEYSWDKSYLEGFRKTIGQGYQIETFEMDTKRTTKSKYEKNAERAWEKIQQSKPQLVVLGDDNALKYLGPKLVGTDIPVVYLGINNNPDDYVPAGRNLTGILERPLFDFNFDTIGKLVKPRPKKIMVLFDHGTTSRSSIAEAFKGKRHLISNGMEIELRVIRKWDHWKTTVTDSINRGFDAIVVGLYHTLWHTGGIKIPASEVIQWTSENTPVPAFGFWDFSVGKDKTIGGFVLSGYEQGKAAAEVATRILSGTSPAEIAPVIGEKGEFVFSRSQVKKHNLNIPKSMLKKIRWVE